MAKSNNAKKNKRFSRDEAERQQPKRSAGDHLKQNAGSENGQERPFVDPKSLVSETVQQAISGVVKLSQQVIEDQIRAGQAAAARLRDDVSQSQQLNDDVKALVDNLVATTRDAGRAWVDLLTIITKAIGEPSGGGQPHPPGGTCGPRHTPSAEPRTTIARTSSDSAKMISSLTSWDPTGIPAEIAVTGYGVKEVILDLRPPTSQFVPLVQPLFSSDHTRSIDGVKFGLSPQRKLVLTVNVPRGLPPGVYVGAIVDSTKKVSGGTVSVTVGR